MADEIIDILDENGIIIGKKSKKEAHKDGSWHQAAHVWIYNSKGELLLQLRARDKDNYPGMWDISAAGHIALGENPDDCALREIYEEIGLKAKKQDLKKINVRKTSKKRADYFNSEFDYVYLYRFDEDISKIELRDGEVEKVMFLQLDKFEAEINDIELSKKYVPHGKYYSEVIEAIKNELNLGVKTWHGAIVLAYKKIGEEIKILLLENADTKKITPIAGAAEEGETQIQAAVRETFEESRWKIKEKDLIQTPVEHIFVYGSHKKERAGDRGENKIFLLDANDLPKPQATKDALNHRWLNIEDAINSINLLDLKERVREAAKYIPK